MMSGRKLTLSLSALAALAPILALMLSMVKILPDTPSWRIWTWKKEKADILQSTILLRLKRKEYFIYIFNVFAYTQI